MQASITAECRDEAEAKSIYEWKYNEFDKALRSIGQFEDVYSLRLASGFYSPEDGEPEEACTGDSLSYNFNTGTLRVQRKPSKSFISEMIENYGDWDDEDPGWTPWGGSIYDK